MAKASGGTKGMQASAPAPAPAPMAKLEGSEKQVKWAEDIRSNMNDVVNKFITEHLSAPENAVVKAAMEEALYNFNHEETSAKYIIDNREDLGYPYIQRYTSKGSGYMAPTRVSSIRQSEAVDFMGHYMGKTMRDIYEKRGAIVSKEKQSTEYGRRYVAEMPQHKGESGYELKTELIEGVVRKHWVKK